MQYELDPHQGLFTSNRLLSATHLLLNFAAKAIEILR
jgi:hypothetical protein